MVVYVVETAGGVAFDDDDVLVVGSLVLVDVDEDVLLVVVAWLVGAGVAMGAVLTSWWTWTRTC